MDSVQEILVIIIVLLAIYFFLIKPSREGKKEERKSKIEEGIVVRWRDQEGVRNFVPKEMNMVAGWGKVRVYEDGDVEFLPESNRERIYRHEELWTFNPYLPTSWRKLKFLEKQGHKIFFADGTDKFESPKTLKILMEANNE